MAENPKKAYGARKVDLSLNPATAAIHQALAHMDGARKYGAYNWRQTNIDAMTYIAAIRRHLDAWAEGERLAYDSGVHHLGHIMACCAILLDAETLNKLEDNRPAQDMPHLYEQLVQKANQFVADRLAKAQCEVTLSTLTEELRQRGFVRTQGEIDEMKALSIASAAETASPQMPAPWQENSGVNPVAMIRGGQRTP